MPTPTKKPFDLAKHNALYLERGWIHADDCACKLRENQPGYVPVTIKPQKPKKAKAEPAPDDVDQDDENIPGTFEPLFEPDEDEDEPTFL